MATLDAGVSGVSIGEQIRRFWRWWAGQLQACIPARMVHWASRVRVAPMVVPEDGGFAVYQFNGVTWQRVAKAAGATPDALAKALGAELRKARIERFAVGLPQGQFLARTINLPQAAEENLRNALRYELDRHTPFKPDDVGFDCSVVGRDNDNREIAVNLVIAQKATIAQALAAVAGANLLVTVVQPAFPDRAMLPINLMPHEDAGSGYLPRVKRWLPWALLALLGLAALLLPIYQKRAQVIEVLPQVNVAAQQAQATDMLHQQLDRAQAEYNFVLQKRYATPTGLQLLAEVTRILPDDTWLQSFELRTTSKGREVQLQGETGVAGKLIELFEQSPLLTGASFKSPVTQAPGSQASRFHLAMDVKEAPTPPARALTQGAETAAPVVPGAPGAPGAATPPGSAGVPAAPPVTSPAAPSAAASTPTTSAVAPVAAPAANGAKPGAGTGK